MMPVTCFSSAASSVAFAPPDEWMVPSGVKLHEVQSPQPEHSQGIVVDEVSRNVTDAHARGTKSLHWPFTQAGAASSGAHGGGGSGWQP